MYFSCCWRLIVTFFVLNLIGQTTIIHINTGGSDASSCPLSTVGCKTIEYCIKTFSFWNYKLGPGNFSEAG
jgi:hypothetical protein